MRVQEQLFSRTYVFSDGRERRWIHGPLRFVRIHVSQRVCVKKLWRKINFRQTDRQTERKEYFSLKRNLKSTSRCPTTAKQASPKPLIYYGKIYHWPLSVFRPHENEKPVFSNSSSLKSAFEKLRFSDGLAWTVDVDKKRCVFSISEVESVDAPWRHLDGIRGQGEGFIRAKYSKKKHYFF